MKIAVISDIHGNLPALRAVLNDIELRKADAIICLGDLVDFAPWTNEVIDLIRSRQIITIMGNHDERIAYDLPIKDKPEQAKDEQIARREAISFTKRTISQDNKQYLQNLPDSITLSFGKKKIHLTHASPCGISEYVYEDDTSLQEECIRLANADVLVIGHTHLPYIKKYEYGSIINVGSVGRTKEADKTASYAIIEVVSNWELKTEIIRVNYLIAETIHAILNSEVPDFYAARLGPF